MYMQRKALEHDKLELLTVIISNPHVKLELNIVSWILYNCC